MAASYIPIETPLANGTTDQPMDASAPATPTPSTSTLASPLSSLMTNASGQKIGFDAKQNAWVDVDTRQPYKETPQELAARPALPAQIIDKKDMVKNAQGQILVYDKAQNAYVDMIHRRPYIPPPNQGLAPAAGPAPMQQVNPITGAPAASMQATPGEATPAGLATAVQGREAAMPGGMAGQAALGFAKGGGEAVENTVGKVIPGQGPTNDELKSTNMAQSGGKLLETLAEFYAGEGAASYAGEGVLEGLTETERLRKLIPVMKMLEENPKLLTAAKAAWNAARAGAVMGGQTLAHGGTAEEAAKSGAIGAGLGLAGSAVWGAGKAGYAALKGAGYAGASLDAATQIAGEAVKPAEEVAQTVQSQINNHEAVAHTAFDNMFEDMKTKIGTKPEPLSGTPLHDAAVSLQADIKKLPGGIASGIRGIVPTQGDLTPLLESLTDGTTTHMTGEQIIDMRQQLSKGLSNPALSPAIRDGMSKLIDGADDTLDHMASNEGHVEGVSEDYQKARAAYRQSMADLKDPFIKRIQNGKISDVVDMLGGGQVVPHNLEVLKRVIGDDAVAGLGLNKFADVIKDATEDGTLSVKKALAGWDKLSEQTKKSMFAATPEVGQRLDQVMDGLRGIAKTQTAIKWAAGAASLATAGLGAAGIASGNLNGASAIETVAGLAALIGVTKFGGGAEFLDSLATNKTLLSGLGKVYGYSGESIAANLGTAGAETAESLAKRGVEDPATATTLQKVK